MGVTHSEIRNPSTREVPSRSRVEYGFREIPTRGVHSMPIPDN
nr:hypothetical protein JVH1_8867 [Rhodococcus sp. JVH1]